MTKRFVSLILLLTLSFLSACSNGSEYVGKWQNLEKKADVIEIVRNGTDFLVLKTSPDLFTGRMKTSRIPLQYQNNTLKLDAGFMSATISYIEKTDTLSFVSVMGTEEYKRASEGE